MYATLVPSRLAQLTDPADPVSPVILCGTRRSGALTTAEDGEVREFVGGVTQTVAYDTALTQLPITLAGLDVQQLIRVTTVWKGRTLLLRTIDGFRYWGAYLQTSETPYYLAGLYEVDVTFTLTDPWDVL